MKNIYLGIDYAGGETGLSSIEFSVYGMRSGDGILITGVEWMVPPSVVLGSSVSAPADSSATSTGTGGYAAV